MVLFAAIGNVPQLFVGKWAFETGGNVMLVERHSLAELAFTFQIRPMFISFEHFIR
jgi:hypothetical protein